MRWRRQRANGRVDRAFTLPPCVDLDELRAAAEGPRDPSRTRVCYLGSPLKKDRLGELLRAAEDLDPTTGDHLELILGGFTLGDVEGIPGVSAEQIEALGRRVRMVGRLKRPELIQTLAESHFSVLLRDPSAGFVRYGFPSKVPEALGAGCPYLGNLTSDLGDYLVDGHNAILVENLTAQSMSEALTRAVHTVRSGQHAAMQAAARTTAETSFDARGWASAFANWSLASEESQVD